MRPAALALALGGCAGLPRRPVAPALVPSAIEVDRSALPALTAELRSKVKDLGLDGFLSPRRERVSRALVLLPQDRAKPGVISFQLEDGPDAGVYQCEALGRGLTSGQPRRGWRRGEIDGKTVYYAPMRDKDGATPVGIYDARVISTGAYELAALDSPQGLEDEPTLAAEISASRAAPKPHFSAVWASWYPRNWSTQPIDLIWAREYQRYSQGARFPFFERRPEPRDGAGRALEAAQLAHDPRYYFGPYGRSGLANHTDRWDEPRRRGDPRYAARPELADFRWRNTDGCLKVRPDCLALLDEWVREQARKGRRAQYEVIQSSLLDRVPDLRDPTAAAQARRP